MQPIRSLIAHARALPPHVFDAGLALLLCIEGLAELFLLTPLEGTDLAIGVVVIVVSTTMLGFRRRLPVTALATQFVGFIVMGEVAGRAWEDNIIGPFFWLLFASFNLGARTEGRHLWAGVAVGTALSCLSTLLDSYPNDIPAFTNSVALAIAGPVLFAHVMRNRARLNRALREKADALRESGATAAEAAALEERTRIAGELHDVVAHALSAMTVQATAARRMAERDPARAEAAFAAVEGTGREALMELRRLLGVLRREDEDLGLAPQPSLVHVGSLIRRAQTSGLPVELLIEGEPRPLPAGVDLTAYRLVQETLRRARDAEAGRAAVTLEYGASDLRVEIVDDGAPVGRRLLGLRERVGVYGGKVQAAPAGPEGWRVAARLPIGRADVAPEPALETLS